MSDRKKHIEITYLIDQQASERMSVISDTSAWQGVEIETYTPIIEHRETPLRLSKRQAELLIPALQEAVDRLPEPRSNCEYPGFVLE